MKKCIVVLGMHRSGTSLMTGLLNIFGVYLGGNFYVHQDSNEKGHFEHNGIWNIDEDILGELGSFSEGYDEFPKNWHKTKNILIYKDKIKKIIIRDFDKLDLFALKDSRISVLLPLYLDIFKELKIEPLFIIMKRKEIEIAKSLKIRNNLSFSHSIKLFKRYYDSVEKYTKGCKKVYVEFDELVQDPKGIVEDISKNFDVKLRNFKDVKKEVSNFLDPKLKHHNLDYKDYLLELGEELERRKIEIRNLIQRLLEKDSDIEGLKSISEYKEEEIKSKDEEIKSKDEELFNIKTSLTWKLNKKIDKLLNKIYPNYYNTLISKDKKIKNIKNISKKKKVLFVNHEESRTGAPKVVFDIAKEMKKYYDVVMVSLKKGSMHEDFKNEFKMVYPKAGCSFLEKKIIAKKVFMREKPDLVYVNCVVSYPYAIEAKKLGIPVVFHIHELEEGFRCSLQDVEGRNFSKWADIFIAVSDKVYNFLVDKKGCNSYQVKLINAFVSSKEVLEKSKVKSYDFVIQEIDKKEDEIVIISVGSVSKRKGADIFIKTHKILKERGYENFKFVWIGGFGLKDQILEDFNNKEEGCLFLGEKKNPFPYLNAADVFLLSSREDPFPLVCLEAMALGKPIVAFRGSGGMPNVIDDCCGLVIDNLNPEKFADAIIDLTENKKLMKEFSEKGKIEQKKYDFENIILKIKLLINDMLENKNIKKNGMPNL